jgi:hypothetical protein
VAALTMPNLVANYQEKATVTKFKKSYSVMSQAYVQALTEYGDPTGWDLIANDSPDGAKNIADKFRPYLNIIKEESSSSAYFFSLNDGSIVKFLVRSPNCTNSRGTGNLAKACGLVELHVKNLIAQLVLTQTGLWAAGVPDDTTWPFSSCKNSEYHQGCTAWIIYNENMDYLHCAGLSWGGKLRCD